MHRLRHFVDLAVEHHSGLFKRACVRTDIRPVSRELAGYAADLRIFNRLGKVRVHHEVEHVGSFALFHLRTGEPHRSGSCVAHERYVYRRSRRSEEREGDVYSLPAVCIRVDFMPRCAFFDRFALVDVFIVGHADERAFVAGGYGQSRGFDVGREGVVSGLVQCGGRGVRRFARAALDHLHASNGHAKVIVVQRERIRGMSLYLRPARVEIAVFDAVNGNAADSSLLRGRILDARVVFCTVSIPHLVIHVYHIARGIEVVGEDHRKSPQRGAAGDAFVGASKDKSFFISLQTQHKMLLR